VLLWFMRGLAVLLMIPSSFRCKTKCGLHRVNIKTHKDVSWEGAGDRDGAWDASEVWA